MQTAYVCLGQQVASPEAWLNAYSCNILKLHIFQKLFIDPAQIQEIKCFFLIILFFLIIFLIITTN